MLGIHRVKYTDESETISMENALSGVIQPLDWGLRAYRQVGIRADHGPLAFAGSP